MRNEPSVPASREHERAPASDVRRLLADIERHDAEVAGDVNVQVFRHQVESFCGRLRTAAARRLRARPAGDGAAPAAGKRGASSGSEHGLRGHITRSPTWREVGLEEWRMTRGSAASMCSPIGSPLRPEVERQMNQLPGSSSSRTPVIVGLRGDRDTRRSGCSSSRVF